MCGAFVLADPSAAPVLTRVSPGHPSAQTCSVPGHLGLGALAGGADLQAGAERQGIAEGRETSPWCLPAHRCAAPQGERQTSRGGE